MNKQGVAARFLRAVGVALVVLGLVHTAATPHIPSLLSGSPPAVYERAVGPTLLNHVLVGILLLPLGYTTWLAASRERNEGWARRTLIANTIVMLMLPVSIAVFMPPRVLRGAALSHRGLVAIISLLMVVATWIRIAAKTE